MILQDWDEIEALRASLREHMAEIHRLRAAGRQALDAMDYTRWAVADQTVNEDVAAHDEAMNKLRAALAEEKNENTVQSTGGVHSRVSDGANCGVEAVTDCHEKAADHVPDATKMMASVREHRTVGATIKDCLIVEPVGYGVFEDGNLHDSFRLEHEAKLFAALKGEHAEVGALYRSPPTSQESRQVEPVAYCTLEQLAYLKLTVPSDDKIAIYTAPPKREPLTEEEIQSLADEFLDWNLAGIESFARAVERVHGIGGEE